MISIMIFMMSLIIMVKGDRYIDDDDDDLETNSIHNIQTNKGDIITIQIPQSILYIICGIILLLFILINCLCFIKINFCKKRNIKYAQIQCVSSSDEQIQTF